MLPLLHMFSSTRTESESISDQEEKEIAQHKNSWLSRMNPYLSNEKLAGKLANQQTFIQN